MGRFVIVEEDVVAGTVVVVAAVIDINKTFAWIDKNRIKWWWLLWYNVDVHNLLVQNISKSGRFVDRGDVGLLAVVVEDNVIGWAVVAVRYEINTWYSKHFNVIHSVKHDFSDRNNPYNLKWSTMAIGQSNTNRSNRNLYMEINNSHAYFSKMFL